MCMEHAEIVGCAGSLDSCAVRIGLPGIGVVRSALAGFCRSEDRVAENRRCEEAPCWDSPQ